MIPKRPKKKAAYYRSIYPKAVRPSHAKAAKVYYVHHEVHMPWTYRTNIMEKRAQAMLKIRMDQVPTLTRDKAIQEAGDISS